MEFNSTRFHKLADYGLAHGITGKVYIDKYNLGLVRFGSANFDPRSREVSPNFTKLPEINEPTNGKSWFIHEGGWLVSWGTYKAPATCFPRAFNSLDSFILWLDKKFKDYRI